MNAGESSSSKSDDNVIKVMYSGYDWESCCPWCKSASYRELEFDFDSDAAIAKSYYQCDACGKKFQVNQ